MAELCKRYLLSVTSLQELDRAWKDYERLNPFKFDFSRRKEDLLRARKAVKETLKKEFPEIDISADKLNEDQILSKPYYVISRSELLRIANESDITSIATSLKTYMLSG